MTEVDKIKRVALKKAFADEARDLTPWLCANIDVVGDAIGVSLAGAEREQSTGNFYVDIRALDTNGHKVIIENQFGSSDHDHLGKLLTYTTSFEAKAAIWIVETPKQEHINVINWLNEKDNGCDFYLMKIEAIQIGESKIAPLITKIVGPSEESKRIGKIKKEDSDREKMRFEFWSKLISLAKSKKMTHFSKNMPSKDSFVQVTAGVNGLSYVIWINQFSSRIELRIDRGKDSHDANIKALNQLRKNKEAIEKSFGSSLNWADLEGYRACSIRQEFSDGGYKSDESEWDGICANLLDNMQRLIDATSKHVQELK